MCTSDISETPRGLADLLLYPTWPMGAVGPCDISLLDPFAVQGTTDNEATTLAKRALADLRADPAGATEARIAVLTAGGVDGLRATAARGNWLDMEQRVAQILVDLLWTAQLTPSACKAGALHGEQTLIGLLKTDGLPQVCERMLQATELPSICNCTLDMVARALPRIHDLAPDIGVESEDWFWWMYNGRNEPPSQYDMQRYEEVAQRLAQSLESMPVFRGLMIVGSFAEPDKHDGFNDLDLYCYCSELPDKQMRTDFFTRLGLDNRGSEIAFEYLELDGVKVHLCLPLLENQRRAIERVWHDGNENDCGLFHSPAFAASAYHLSRSRILRDPAGLLSRWKEQVKHFPPALGRQIRQVWRPVWERYSPRVRQALHDNDRVHAMIALTRCHEACLRILAADNGVLCDPNTLKWLLHETPRLPEPQRNALLPAVNRTRFRGVPALRDQFHELSSLWNSLEHGADNKRMTR